jgi:hypothetical protein
MLFILAIGTASVNYLWYTNTAVQIIEEETHSAPLSKKSVNLDEDHLSKWLTDFIDLQILFDHGVEVFGKESIPFAACVHTPVETPPPDRA